AGSTMEVSAAAEGMCFDVEGKGSGKTIVDLSALERRPIVGSRVMMITEDQADFAALEGVLPEDGLVLVSSRDGHSALEAAATAAPDLIIINSKLKDGDGASFIQPLRDRVENAELPVILLTDGAHGTETLYSAESVATDYLARP